IQRGQRIGIVCQVFPIKENHKWISRPIGLVIRRSVNGKRTVNLLERAFDGLFLDAPFRRSRFGDKPWLRRGRGQLRDAATSELAGIRRTLSFMKIERIGLPRCRALTSAW